MFKYVRDIKKYYIPEKNDTLTSKFILFITSLKIIIYNWPLFIVFIYLNTKRGLVLFVINEQIESVSGTTTIINYVMLSILLNQSLKIKITSLSTDKILWKKKLYFFFQSSKMIHTQLFFFFIWILAFKLFFFFLIKSISILEITIVF